MRFRTIDGLRGIAAMAVVVFHLSEATRVAFGEWLPHAIDQLFRHGHFGVDIFFVISGFVIAYSVRTASPTLPFVGRFALRRSIRLDPPYWVAIFLEITLQAIALRLGFSEAPLPSLPQIAAHFFYLQNLLGLGDIVDIFWTLCFEIQFYLALISLLVIRRKLDVWLGPRVAGPLATLALAALFLYSIGIRFNVAGLSGHPGVATIRWYQFFMGTCAWWIVDGKLRWSAFPSMSAVLLLTVLGTGAPLLELLPIGVVGLLLWSYRRNGMQTVLSNRVLQFLGAISYSLYVFHSTIGWRLIRLIGAWIGDSPPPFVPLLVFLAGVSVSVLFAWIAWRLIESPSMRLSKRVELPRRQEAPPASPPTAPIEPELSERQVRT